MTLFPCRKLLTTNDLRRARGRGGPKLLLLKGLQQQKNIKNYKLLSISGLYCYVLLSYLEHLK